MNEIIYNRKLEAGKELEFILQQDNPNAVCVSVDDNGLVILGKEEFNYPKFWDGFPVRFELLRSRNE